MAISHSQFEELFCRFHSRIAGYATVMLGDEMLGEDIAQEVFAHIWEKRGTLHLYDGFHGYLFQSTHSLCIDHIRKNKQSEKYASHSLIRFAEEHRSCLEMDAEPFRKLFLKDFKDRLNALLEELPQARQKVFGLVYRDGLRSKEVAEKLQMPQRTVESHIYLSLKFLRKRLSPSDFLF